MHVTAMLARLESRRLRDERGQTMAEYVVVLAIISIAVMTALSVLGGGIGTSITQVAGRI